MIGMTENQLLNLIAKDGLDNVVEDAIAAGILQPAHNEPTPDDVLEAMKSITDPDFINEYVDANGEIITNRDQIQEIMDHYAAQYAPAEPAATDTLPQDYSVGSLTGQDYTVGSLSGLHQPDEIDLTHVANDDLGIGNGLNDLIGQMPADGFTNAGSYKEALDTAADAAGDTGGLAWYWYAMIIVSVIGAAIGIGYFCVYKKTCWKHQRPKASVQSPRVYVKSDTRRRILQDAAKLTNYSPVISTASTSNQIASRRRLEQDEVHAFEIVLSLGLFALWGVVFCMLQKRFKWFQTRRQQSDL